MNTKNTNMSTTNKLARGAMVAVLAVAAMGMGGVRALARRMRSISQKVDFFRQKYQAITMPRTMMPAQTMMQLHTRWCILALLLCLAFP
jgi:uncharacterized protein HemX